MLRTSGTSRNGSSFNALIVAAVWNKAQIVAGYDPTQVRKDSCGAWIKRVEYGETTEYGWEIDHIVPATRGGADSLDNLQPLHWRNNRHKADEYPRWTCAIGTR